MKQADAHELNKIFQALDDAKSLLYRQDDRIAGLIMTLREIAIGKEMSRRGRASTRKYTREELIEMARKAIDGDL